ncbi:MAG: DUF1543 domain-containing protein [Proteobacteria bacterium]|nr:MAG: DUF1543 domain-containing protein [Pseudomonadota bacterium]
MNMYIIHCGFYDATDAAAIFENHANFYIVAEDFVDAKAQMKAHPTFRKKGMHIDGIQEIVAVNGYRVKMIEDKKLEGKTQVINLKYGSRAPTLTEV